jgi:hypothetical protein
MLMARTNADAVKGVLRLGSEGGDYDDDFSPSLIPYIDAASMLIDQAVTCAAKKNKALTTTQQEILERWVAAHFYCCSDRTYQARNTAQAGGTFSGQTAMYLEATLYGQTAMRLDPSGCLAAIGGKQRNTARGIWLGKPDRDERAYEDRN